MTAANDDSMALHDLAADEAREIAGGEDESPIQHVLDLLKPQPTFPVPPAQF